MTFGFVGGVGTSGPLRLDALRYQAPEWRASVAAAVPAVNGICPPTANLIVGNGPF